MKPSTIQAEIHAKVPVFEEDDYSMEEVFHEYTKLTRENAVRISRRVSRLMRDARLRGMVARSWKTYRGHATIPLSPPSLGPATAEDVLRNRFSISSMPGASFSATPMTVAQLGSMLGFSYGVTHSKKIAGSDEEHSFRATPSAGGLYPLEIYPVVFNVEGLEPGIYHYGVMDHCLEVVRKGWFRPQFLAATSSPEIAEHAAVVYIATAVLQRNLFKYQHRGYRFIMNDVGALLQSLYITGTALGLGTCALGGFFDDEMGKIVGANNVDEVTVICFLAGPMKRSFVPGNGQKG